MENELLVLAEAIRSTAPEKNWLKDYLIPTVVPILAALMGLFVARKSIHYQGWLEKVDGLSCP